MRPAREVILERWDEVDRIFSDALGQPERHRLAFVEEMCGDDRELFDTVNTLLAASVDEGDDLSRPGPALLAAAFEEEADVRPGPAPGDLVGPYRLTREIGRGGMATVFAAERVDGAFESSVAIKILRGGDTEDIARRFRAERQILSSLAHPHIARLLDGGSTSEGRPFLVMELVDGERITSWADRNALDVPGRLDLFVQAADAVLFAHRHLVVHRDIKPSNVLVGQHDGSVKLLDFGIAKLLEPGAGTTAETGTATHWMTPEYASPEQIQSQPVTTATDVHALGLLLFELLTGRHPFSRKDASGFELGRAISDDVPKLASTVVGSAGGRPGLPGTTPDGLRRLLAGDLDAIISKALRKRPEDRYSSVQAMLDDVERHRTGFPVRAREGMAAYRGRKFIGRHRLGVTAAAAVLLFVGASMVTLTRLQATTARERDRANIAAEQATIEAENAQLVIGFLADVFRGRNPGEAPSDTITARELLAWGTERVETEYADRPEVQWELYAVMGGAHLNLGLIDEGSVLLERALEIARRVLGAQSEDAASMLLRVGQAHQANSETERAFPYLEEAVRVRRELYSQDDPLVAEALLSLGFVLRDLDRADSAEVVLREAERISRAPGSERVLALRAALALAYVLRGQGRLEESERLYERAVPEALVTPELIELDLATHLNNFAYLRRVRGDYQGADTLYRQAMSISTELYGRGHPRSLLIGQNLASTLGLMGRDDELVAVLRENVNAAKGQWPNGHWRVGQSEVALGRAYLSIGRPGSAKAPLLAGTRSYTEQLGADHTWTYFAVAAYRVVQILVDDDPQARHDLDRFYAVLRQSYDDAGGELSPDWTRRVESLLSSLNDPRMQGDSERFRAMLPPDSLR